MGESILQLSALRGAQATALRFGPDFVEFEFGAESVRIFGGLEFRARGFHISRAEAGWRDAVCSLIGDSVSEIDLTSQAVVNVVFKSGARLSIDIGNGGQAGSESMQYIKRGQLEVSW